jgi:hypothetical protein
LHLVDPYQFEEVGLDAVLELYVQPLFGEETFFAGHIERGELYARNVAQPKHDRCKPGHLVGGYLYRAGIRRYGHGSGWCNAASQQERER